MKCPYCGNLEDKVLDTRPTDENSSIRRRRECLNCAKRFTTYEVVEMPPVIIVKKDGTKQQFDKSKLMTGLLRACEKRPVDVKTMNDVCSKIEQLVKCNGEKEVQSSFIGSLLLETLKEIDLIAYIRFASVYNQFNDVDEFLNELNSIIRKE